MVKKSYDQRVEEVIMKYIKENWKFLLFVIIVGIIGSIFTVIYSFNSLDSKMLEEAINQFGSKELVMAISVIQTVIMYVVVCGIFGIILSNKVGLWKKIKFEKNKLLAPIMISIIGGLFLSVGDLYIFGSFNEIVKHSYDLKPSIEYIIASFTYGGVIEEVMMRLFLMSLISFIIAKIFYKKEKDIPIKVFVIANIISALLFALGHLPATIQLFGGLDSLLLIRCLIMNGIFGLAFGWLYRKYGIHYSMVAHFGCHLVSKIIWLIFI